MVRVRATALGFYGHIRRREGDVFDVPEELFSERWMQRVSDTEPEKKTTGLQEARLTKKRRGRPRKAHDPVALSEVTPPPQVPGVEST